MTAKRGRAGWAERHLANPSLRALLRLGVAPRAFALLEPPAGAGLPRSATASTAMSSGWSPRTGAEAPTSPT